MDWRNLFPTALVNHDLIFGSDHCPLILNLSTPRNKVPYRFKFESMWCTSEECKEIVSKAWNQPSNTSPDRALTSRLSRCSAALRKWGRSKFGNNNEKIKEFRELFGWYQQQTPTADSIQREKILKEELEVTMLREEMYLHQRSRVNWISYGDKNTAFFHSTLTQRRQRNQITKIKGEDGVWVSKEDDINSHLQEYFSSLFRSSGTRDFGSVLEKVDKKVTQGMNNLFTQAFTDEEIKEAVFQMGALKAPGPDGFPGLFYQRFWDIVGGEVCKMVKYFFNEGDLLREFNTTNLVLIPKIPFPEELSQFRPISLCNFILKIITKAMANRLKKVLKWLISPNQSAFVPGRMIQDSIVVAHEAFHFLKRKKKGADGYMALKLDFNKAYDRVEWDFLEEVLRKMGFEENWIRWTMECITTVNFDIFVNGEARSKVSPGRGLRQGDPLSPYLFVLVKDVLSKLMQQGIADSQREGMIINKHCPVLSHIFFADDAILFLKAELKNCRAVKSILDLYGLASGQLINFNKSSISFSANMCATEKQLICDFLNVKHSRGDSKYLGLPSFWGRSKAEAYAFIVEKALKKMQGWKAKCLSLGGKETLIKSVVQGIPTYAMAYFLLPKSICDKLNALSRNFWWKGDPADKGIN